MPACCGWWVLAVLLAVGLVFYHLGGPPHDLAAPDTGTACGSTTSCASGVWFVAGALLAEVRHLVVRRHLVAAGALAVAVIGIGTHQAMVAIPALACLVIYVGTLPCRPAERLHRLGDPSYGMYLSGFVIQQMLVWAGLVHVHQPWLSFLEGAVLATTFGYASWHLVEKRAMRLVKPKRPSPRRRRARRARRSPQVRSSRPSRRWPMRSRLVRR